MEQGGREVVLGPGESAYADKEGGVPSRIRGTPGFIRTDVLALPNDSLACLTETIGLPAPKASSGTRTTAQRSAAASSDRASPDSVGQSSAGNWNRLGNASGLLAAIRQRLAATGGDKEVPRGSDLAGIKLDPQVKSVRR